MTIMAERRADELRALATRMLQMANDLEKDKLEVVAPAQRESLSLTSWDGEDSELLLIKASEIYLSRRRRKKYISQDLFGEPAWDLLLDLFISRLKKKRVSVSSACIAADVPLTTALRWLGILVENNLIERFDSETDQRVRWVQLTDSASQTMAEFVRDSIKKTGKSFSNSDQYLVTSNTENIS